MNNFLMNLRMSRKLMVAPLIAIFFLAILSLLSYQGIKDQRDTFNDYRISSKIIADLTVAHVDGYRLLNWIGAKYEAAKIDALKAEQLSIIDRNLKHLQTILNDPQMDEEKKKIYGASFKSMEAYQKDVLDVDDMASSELMAAVMMMRDADEKFRNLNKNLQALQVYEDRISDLQYKRILTIFMAVFALAVVLSVASGIFMTRVITHPIHETMKVIKQVASGDLTQDVSMVAKDEMGHLAQSVNAMRLSMSQAVGESLITSQSVSEAASEQASTLEETSSSLNEIASMIKQNADNTVLANNLLSPAIDAIQKVDASMKDLTKSMQDIAGSSEQTRNIVKSIDEIAFQTNLLALNAAVEAARAGEAGTGFAVVADEVRNLAMRATEAAKTTSELIGSTMDKIKNGENLAVFTDSAFTQVMQGTTKVMQLMEEIATASQEQAQGIDQINSAIAEMSIVTQQNAANAEKLASAMAMFKMDEQAKDRTLTPVKHSPVKRFAKGGFYEDIVEI